MANFHTVEPDTSYRSLCRLRDELSEAIEELPEGSEQRDRLLGSLGRIKDALREHNDPYWYDRETERTKKRAGGY